MLEGDPNQETAVAPIVRATVLTSLLMLPAVAGSTEPPATVVVLLEPTFAQPQILTATSMPPQFELILTREMPTPRWRFSIDEVKVDEENGRIVARVTEIAPDGVSSQAITPTPCRIPLGRLTRGRYLIELWVRRGTQGSHWLAQALVVIAR